MSERYIEMNRVAWNQRIETHFKSSFYDVPGFLSGRTNLREIELAEMGPGERQRCYTCSAISVLTPCPGQDQARIVWMWTCRPSP